MTKIENKSDFTMSVQRLLTNSIVREEAMKRGSGKHPSPKLGRKRRIHVSFRKDGRNRRKVLTIKK